METPTEETLKKIIGHEFPGGEYIIAHWENFLLTECTGSEFLPNGLAHPVALFHVPILGAGTSIGEMFQLGHANSPFSIGIESYEWEIHQPLLEETTYKISGKIEGAERKTQEGRLFDRIQFRFDLELEGSPVASSTIIWHYNRGRSDED